MTTTNDHTTPDPALTPAEPPRPNIKFVGRDVWDRAKRKVIKTVDPIEHFNDAGDVYTLPPADFQKRRRLFYHKAADHIAATFPHLYKIVLKRG